jgi:hypothetical protein
MSIIWLVIAAILLILYAGHEVDRKRGPVEEAAERYLRQDPEYCRAQDLRRIQEVEDSRRVKRAVKWIAFSLFFFFFVLPYMLLFLTGG